MPGTHPLEVARIQAEYQRRAREIPPGNYCLSRPAILFFHTQRTRAILRALSEEKLLPMAGLRIADIGCGTGDFLLEYARWGAQPQRLSGIDLDEPSLSTARKRMPLADIRSGDAGNLPWPGAYFDLVTQITAFTSILIPSMKHKVAAEMLRVVKPDGAILWYDFRFDNPANPNVRGIEAAEIRSLFPGCAIRLRKVTLAPPLSRRIVPISWIAALALEKLPFLRTHYLGVIRPNR